MSTSSPDPWSVPSTSAGHAGRDASDVVAAEDAEAAVARNLLLFRLMVGFASFLCVAFVAVVGGGAYAHGVDRDLFTVWWSHHAEYDCCYASEAKCEPGVEALVELRARLKDREGGVRDAVSRAVGSAVGLADLDVSDAPVNVAGVDRIFASCPALSRTALQAPTPR